MASGFSNSKLKPTKRGNPCPICSDTSGDCRDGGERILCHSFIDGGAAPSGWKWLKQSTNGLWGVFISSANSDDSNWQDQIEERNRQRQQDQADRQKKYADGLTLHERNSNARKLLKQCPLTSQDKSALVARGIPENLLHLFGSVYRGKVVLGISQKFPGIFTLNGGGQSVLLAPDINSGILCPVFSSDGLIIGFQIRVADATNNKYRWLKSGYSSHLQNGELPLTYIGDAHSDYIQFAEGVLKPFIIGGLSGIATIGAAGGNFTGSLEQLSQLVAGKESAILVPDAGAIINEMVMLQYLHLQQFLAKKGIPLQVWWWGQFDKTSLDGDDLLAAGRWGETELIGWAKFVALASAEVQAYLSELTPKDFAAEEAEYQRQMAEDTAYQEYQNEQADAEVREDARQQQQAQATWESTKDETEWLRWIDRKKFTPSEEVNQEFIDINFNVGDCLAIKSITGTGKTQWVIRESILHKFGFFNLGSRNSLMQNTSERCFQSGINSYWIHEGEAEKFIPDKASAIHLCIDSLLKITVENAEGRVILIDETVSVLFHALASSTCQQQRFSMLARLDALLGVCGGLILLDANLTDWVVADIYKRCPQLKLRKVKNNYRPTIPWNVTLIRGAINAKGVENSRDKSPAIAVILDAADPIQRRYISIASDSQKAVETISGLLDARHVDIGADPDVPGDVAPISGFRVDSETTGEPLVQEFLKNPNAAIQKHCPGYIAYSPTAESGLDISIRDYFDLQVNLFYWQNTDSMLQLMGRTRNCQERIVALPEFIGGDDEMFIKSHSSAQVERAAVAYAELIADIHSRDFTLPGEAEKLIQELFQSNQTGWEDTWCKFTAMHNYEKHNAQKCLKWRLEEAGHNVHISTPEHDDGASKEFKEERKSVVETKSNVTFSAEPMESVAAATKILSTFGASVIDRRRAEKTLILHHLPGIEATPSWSAELVQRMLHDDKYWRSRLERYWLLLHPEVSRNISLGFWDNAINNKSAFFTPDKLRDRGLQVWALDQLNILDFINSHATWTDDSPEIEALLEAGKNKRIADAVGIHPGKGGGVRYLGRLLGLIGLSFKVKKLRCGDDVIRSYSISQLELYDPARLDVLDCVSRKFEQREWHFQQSPPSEKSVAHTSSSLRTTKVCATGSNADGVGITADETEKHSSADFDLENQKSSVEDEVAAAQNIDEPLGTGEAQEEEMEAENVTGHEPTSPGEGTLQVGGTAISTVTGEQVEILEVNGGSVLFRYLNNSRASYSGWGNEGTSPIELLRAG